MQIHRFSLKLCLLALFSAASAVHAQVPIAGGASNPVVVGQPQIISPAPMPTSGNPPAPKPASSNPPAGVKAVEAVPAVGPQIGASKGNNTVIGPGQSQNSGVPLPTLGGSVAPKPLAQKSQFSFSPIPMKTKAQCIAAFNHEIDSFTAELAAANKAGRMNPEAEKKAKALALEKNSPAMSKIASGPTCQTEHAKYAAARAEFVWSLARFKANSEIQCINEINHQRAAFAKEAAFALEHIGTMPARENALEPILGPGTVFAGMATLPLKFAAAADCDKMQIKLLNERGRLMAEFYPMLKK